jgi:hypothetical protein
MDKRAGPGANWAVCQRRSPAPPAVASLDDDPHENARRWFPLSPADVPAIPKSGKEGRKDVRMLGRITTLAILLLSVAAYAQNAARDRHFVFHYSFTVKNLTAGQPLRVWIPLAHSDAYQDVHVISQKS